MHPGDIEDIMVNNRIGQVWLYVLWEFRQPQICVTLIVDSKWKDEFPSIRNGVMGPSRGPFGVTLHSFQRIDGSPGFWEFRETKDFPLERETSFTRLF
jgi:hypothetical protein